MRKLVYNGLKTPDGTIVESLHRHDFNLYRDKNGKEYGADGGLSYLRRIGELGEDISVYLDEPFEKVRKFAYRYDSESAIYVKLKDISQEWLDNILEFFTTELLDTEELYDRIDPNYLLLYFKENLQRMEEEY